MISGELLLILLVACVVFGPNRLPLLARHLGLLISQINRLRVQLNQFWQEQVSEQQLLENQQKAEEADVLYRERSARRE